MGRVLLLLCFPFFLFAQERCGDGLKQLGEQCDTGARNSNTTPGACREDCTLARCGDGVEDPFETCDDGNTADGDTCPASCFVKSPFCGNGAVDDGEQCDDGSANSDEYGPCLTTCRSKQFSACGNKRLDADEQCDDGNRINDDDCTNECRKNVCGNGSLDYGEQCDDGNRENNDSCHNNCQVPRCGDGIVDEAAGELCDDGNTRSFDHCSANCQKKTVPAATPPKKTPDPAEDPEEPEYAPVALTPKSPGVALAIAIACSGFCPVFGASAGLVYTRDWGALAANTLLNTTIGFGFGVSLAKDNSRAALGWLGLYAANQLAFIIYTPYSAKKYNHKWFGVDRVPGALRVTPAFDTRTGSLLMGGSLQLRF